MLGQVDGKYIVGIVDVIIFNFEIDFIGSVPILDIYIQSVPLTNEFLIQTKDWFEAEQK